jgi:hypothetical protein
MMFNEDEIMKLVQNVVNECDGFCHLGNRIVAYVIDFDEGFTIIVKNIDDCHVMLEVKMLNTGVEWVISEVYWNPTYPKWTLVEEWLTKGEE